MDVTVRAEVLRRFEQMPDPRGRNTIHRLPDLVVMAILAVICGADGWVQVALFAKTKRQWLATFLDLSDGIPSHDTFGRVFSLLKPDTFPTYFNIRSILNNKSVQALLALAVFIPMTLPS